LLSDGDLFLLVLIVVLLDELLLLIVLLHINRRLIIIIFLDVDVLLLLLVLLGLGRLVRANDVEVLADGIIVITTSSYTLVVFNLHLIMVRLLIGIL